MSKYLNDIKFGATLQGVSPPDQFIAAVRQMEDWGYDYFWLTDSSLHARYVYSYLTLAAVNTTHMMLGTDCTHPHTRHPAINVNAMATINELSGGRGIPGIEPVTARCRSSNADRQGQRALFTVEAARRLLNGERFDFDGPLGRKAAIQLGLHGLKPPKIHLVVSGPKMLELAGEVADGAIIQCGAFKEGLEFAFKHLRIGAERAGRRVEDMDIGWLLFGIVAGADREAARKAIRPLAAWFPMRAPAYCEVAGIPADLVEKLKAVYAGGEFHEARKAHEPRLTR
jgi:5,10-methylenetetrahydromethanopterin reductase